MKKIIVPALFALTLLWLLTSCGGPDPVLSYYVDGTLYHTDTLETEGERFGNIGKEPTKEGFYFGGWFYDENTWKQPLDYTELNTLREEEDPHVSAKVYAKWEVVDLRFEESTRTYTVVGLLGGAGSKVAIPAKYKNFPITQIAPEAFRGNAVMTAVVIPDTVTEIGDNAFAECVALEKVNLPNSVTKVGRAVFSNCISLTKATLSTAMQEIGFEMFYNCNKLTDITLPKGLRKIGARAFASCSSLSVLTLPINANKLGNNFLLDTAVETLTYNGTKTRWQSIDSASALAGSSVSKIVCLDGEVIPEK